MQWFNDKEYLILDCDGVILDSNHMKIKAFLKVAEPYLTKDELRGYQEYVSNSFGKSRYVILEHLIDTYCVDIKENKLLKIYADFIKEDYLTCDETVSALEFIKKSYTSKTLYVVSGSDEDELKVVFEKRGLLQYFVSIHGSPASKLENLSKLLNKIPVEKAVYIGDTLSDYSACSQNNLDFIFMKQYSTISKENLSIVESESQGVVLNLGELL